MVVVVTENGGIYLSHRYSTQQLKLSAKSRTTMKLWFGPNLNPSLPMRKNQMKLQQHQTMAPAAVEATTHPSTASVLRGSVSLEVSDGVWAPGSG